VIAAKLHLDDHQHLIQSAAGIIFLGTPHQGSRSQSWAKLIGTIASEFGLGHAGIFNYIESNSAILRDQLHDFTLVANRANIPIFCFFERYETNIAQILLPKSWTMMKYKVRRHPRPFVLPHTDNLQELVVDEISGCIDGFPKLGLALDHFQLNKFPSSDDNNYILVSAQVVKMAEEGSSRVRARLNRESSSQNAMTPS
jgi:hypothetical protein